MENERKQPMTFRELKEFCNSLNETQLDTNVAVHDEENGTYVYGADVSEDNFYYNQMEPEDCFFEADFFEALEAGDIEEKTDYVCVPKGTPRLWNFA